MQNLIISIVWSIPLSCLLTIRLNLNNLEAGLLGIGCGSLAYLITKKLNK